MAISALLVRGPFRGATGYEHHTREFVRELHRSGVAIQLGHVTDWAAEPPRPGFVDPWYESLTEPVGATTTLHFSMPHQLRRQPGCTDVNFTMFESTRIPAFWAALSRRIDWTVVPTEFSRRAWIESGAPEERLRVCPLGVRGELFAGPHEPLPIVLANGRPLAGYGTRVVNVSAWNGRKNLEGLIRAWLTSTRASDDAAFVIKTHLDEHNRAVALPWLLKMCEYRTGRSLNEAAPIHFEHTLLDDDEMPRFYAAASHYFSLSHGEGWDLPMMEAIATGLIPIAPDHSAYRTYLDPAVALLIPSQEVPVPPPHDGGWFRGLTWWDPDETAAAELIRAVLDRGLAPVASARDRILGEYTWQRAAARLIEILDEVTAISPLPVAAPYAQ